MINKLPCMYHVTPAMTSYLMTQTVHDASWSGYSMDLLLECASNTSGIVYSALFFIMILKFPGKKILGSLALIVQKKIVKEEKNDVKNGALSI